MIAGMSQINPDLASDFRTNYKTSRQRRCIVLKMKCFLRTGTVRIWAIKD